MTNNKRTIASIIKRMQTTTSKFISCALETGAAIIATPYFAFRFVTAPAWMPETERPESAEKLERIFTEAPQHDYRLLTLPDVKALARFVKATDTAAKRRPYIFGVGLPAVSARYLLCIMQMLPRCRLYADANKPESTMLYAVDDDGNTAIMMPVRKKEASEPETDLTEYAQPQKKQETTPEEINTNTNTTEEEKTMTNETMNNTGWTGVQDYAERKAAKIERMQEKAEAARERAAQLQKPIHDVSGDTAFFTQPNINTAGGRAFTTQRERMFSQFEKGFDELEKAAHYEQKAESAAENTAISSDDPEALQKLRAKLESLEALQARMKAANTAIRMKDTAKGDAKLIEMGFDAKQIEELRTPDFCGRVGFPSYALSNNNANIRRIRERIAELEKRASAPAPQGWKFNGGEVVANVEENRYQVIFDEIPDEETRNELKKNGFRWSRTNKAWQRMLNTNTLRALRRIDALAPIAEEAAQAETVEAVEAAETPAQDAQPEALNNTNEYSTIETGLKEIPVNILDTTADNSNDFTPPTQPEKPTPEAMPEAPAQAAQAEQTAQPEAEQAAAVFIPGMLYTCGNGAVEIVEISGNRIKFTWKRIKPGFRTAKLETDADGNQCFWFGCNRYKVNAMDAYKPTAAAQQPETVKPSEPADSVKRFEVGKVYGVTSNCNSDCLYTFTCIKRTKCFVWLQSALECDGIVKVKVDISDGCEICFPKGHYSLAPVLGADDVLAYQTAAEADEAHRRELVEREKQLTEEINRRHEEEEAEAVKFLLALGEMLEAEQAKEAPASSLTVSKQSSGIQMYSRS